MHTWNYFFFISFVSFVSGIFIIGVDTAGWLSIIDMSETSVFDVSIHAEKSRDISIIIIMDKEMCFNCMLSFLSIFTYDYHSWRQIIYYEIIS